MRAHSTVGAWGVGFGWRCLGRATLLAGLLPILTLLGTASRPPTTGPSQAWGDIGPIADWDDDVDDDTGGIDDDTSDAKVTIGSSTGQLTEPDLSHVAGLLNSIETTIDRILDPNQFPNLDPVSAGSIDTSINPSTLPEYATACATLAHAAVVELQTPTPSAGVVGTKLKTILHLITRSPG